MSDIARPPLAAIVADDDDDERELLAMALRRVGFDVYEARDGTEVVSIARVQGSTFRLIVSDIGMPIVDGIDAAIAIREFLPEAVVIFVTAFADPWTLRRANLAGARCVLLKPVDMRSLAAAVLEITVWG